MAELTITPVESSRLSQAPHPAPDFGTVFSDHMLVADFADGAWGEPRIMPYGSMPLAPSMSALHYGQSCFEGFKARRTVEGEVVLFRYEDNHARLNRSAARLAMAPIPAPLFLDGVRALVDLDRDWIPQAPGGALYLRPVYFASDEAVGVRPSSRYRLAIITCPVGAYFSEPISLLAEEHYVRAFPGGTGDVKSAGNYAGSLLAARQAKERGFDNVIWLDARERRFVEECGVMNIFFVRNGVAITPPLGGTILPGITRDSLITLLREMGIDVAETPIAIDEVMKGVAAGRVTEAFGVGTAAMVTPIKRIHYHGQDVHLNVSREGSIAQQARARLDAVQTGRVLDSHGWLTTVENRRR